MKRDESSDTGQLIFNDVWNQPSLTNSQQFSLINHIQVQRLKFIRELVFIVRLSLIIWVIVILPLQ